MQAEVALVAHVSRENIWMACRPVQLGQTTSSRTQASAKTSPISSWLDRQNRVACIGPPGGTGQEAARHHP